MSDDRQDPLPDDAGDETRPLPEPGDQARPEPAGGQVWSGRAGVPPPRPADYRDPAGEWYGEEQPGRRWWTPILLGVVALLLLGLLGVGFWLALSAGDGIGPEETPSTGPTSTTGAPTTEATTTAAAMP